MSNVKNRLSRLENHSTTPKPVFVCERIEGDPDYYLCRTRTGRERVARADLSNTTIIMLERQQQPLKAYVGFNPEEV